MVDEETSRWDFDSCLSQDGKVDRLSFAKTKEEDARRCFDCRRLSAVLLRGTEQLSLVLSRCGTSETYATWLGLSDTFRTSVPFAGYMYSVLLYEKYI